MGAATEAETGGTSAGRVAEGATFWLGGAEVPTLPLPLPRLAIFASLSLLSSSVGLLVPRLLAIGSANKKKGVKKKKKKTSVNGCYECSARLCSQPSIHSQRAGR